MTLRRRILFVLIRFGLAAGQTPPKIDYPGPVWNSTEYTTSSEVYPPPDAVGNGWEGAFVKSSDFVANLTLEEKVQLITGAVGPCVGNIGPIERLDFAGLCLQDGPLSIRQADHASVFPAGLTVAASWDRELARRRGQDLGREFKAKGAHIILGPVAGPLGRSGYGGRNWEGFSPDPYITGELFSETIVGIQRSGVQACGKHYIGNEQETMRFPMPKVDSGIRIESVSANIADRTMHELYLWPWANAVKSGMSSVMCSYNRLNQTFACQDSKTLNGLLKSELGFQGYVMSDWGATNSGYQAAAAGLDMSMPGWIDYYGPKNTSFFGGNATMSVKNGSWEMARLDDACRRIMTPYFQLKQDVKHGFPAVDGANVEMMYIPPDEYTFQYKLGPASKDVRNHAHTKRIRELGAAGIVLLKNVNDTLPLKKPSNIGVFGNAAGDITAGLYFLNNLDTRDVGYEFGHLPVGGGSGNGRLSYSISPLDAIKTFAANQGNNPLVQYVLNHTLITEREGYFNFMWPRPPDVCLVFLKTWATEGFDRSSLLVDWNGTAVVENIAARCGNTVVVTNSGGLNVLPFANHPNVTAILAAHYGGQEQGNSIADVLWGRVNPSGKLPYTIPLKETDFAFSSVTNSTELLLSDDPLAWQSDFKEHGLIDYRWFDYHNLPVQYEFGFGLSYTNFSMEKPKIKTVSQDDILPTPPEAETIPGGNPELWKSLYIVTVDIINTGKRPGAAVPQLYVGSPPSMNEEDVTPVKVLRGFEKVMLKAGQRRTVSFELTRRDISYWDVYAQQWLIAPGEFTAMLGFSSRDIQGNVSFTPIGSG